MAPFQPKTTSNSSSSVKGNVTVNANSTTTLYSQISEIQPIDLLQRLDKEGISTRGDMPGLRARLLRHELRKLYPETNAALHKDLELTGKEAENWCTMMHLWEIDMRARIKMREQQERSCLIVDRKLDDSMTARKPFENDVAEKNRVDYLLSCEKLLKSWQLEYAGGKGQTAKEFLENLHDFRKFAEIGDQVLLLMLPSVLKNEARAWYRAKNFATWGEFETAFIQYTIMSNQPRVPMTPSLANKGPQQRTLPQTSVTTPSTTATPQLPTRSIQSDVIRPTIEGRMTQSFAFGQPDISVRREQQKPQKGEQEQLRTQVLAATLIHRNSEDEHSRRLREHELHRARYIEYLQQSRLECMKERFQPHTNIRATSVNNRSDKTQASNHVECVKKLRLWNVKYSGQRGRAVIEFIEDLMDFRKYANVSDEVLLDVLPCVLSGNIKSWYRRPSLLIERWSTWEQFKEEFLKRFYDSTAAEESLKSVINVVKEL